MNLIKPSIFLIFATVTALMNDQVTGQIAVCDYKFTWFELHTYLRTVLQGLYSCMLNTEQLTFGEVLTTIQGYHKRYHDDVRVRYLKIKNFNKLSKLSSIFCNKFSKLEILNINDASIESLDANSLSNCGELISLDSFDGLQSFYLLDLGNNKISDLPVGVFTFVRNLKVLYLYNNRLTTINSDFFGIDNQLNEFYLQDNKINAIDPKFIENTAVYYLNVTNNICSQSEIKSRREMKKNLIKCFENFQPRSQLQQEFLPKSQIQPQRHFQSQPQPQIQQQPQQVSEFHNQLTMPRKAQKVYCGQQVTGHGNIIGGAHVNRGDFPWKAALVRTNGQFFCGGSIVTNRKIVTAAHCIQEKGVSKPALTRDILVLLGIYDLDNPYEAGRIVSSIQSINMHPDWNPNIETFDADIAVLVLANEVFFSATVQPICLTKSEAITSGFVVGYGKSEDITKVHENIPKLLETPIYKNDDCFLKNYLLATLSSHRTFCGGTGTGTGVCNGDSGSGLIIFDRNAYYLRGIVSSSLFNANRECDVNTYSIFTSVAYYIDWIYGIPISRFK